MRDMTGETTAIAAFDVGTTSAKVCLFDLQLHLLACSVQEYALDTVGGRVEAPAKRYLDALCAGMAEVRRTAPTARVRAVGLATQGETLVPVDRAGRPLRPFIVWLDDRAGQQAARLEKALTTDGFYRRTGLPELTGALPLAKLLWLKENEPQVLASAHKVLLLEDYLLFWLTGQFVSERSLQTSTGWFSLEEDEIWPEALTAVGAAPELLPRLVECGEPVGCILPGPARQLGLEPDVTVVAGAMDQTAAALFAGCTRPGAVTETTGTALVAAACTDRPCFEGAHRVTVYRHALPGKFLYLLIGNTAGMALRWFRDEFCRDLPPGGAGYAALDELARQAPLGCGGLVFLPFLAGSVDPEACPGARGVFLGAGLASNRAHFARAVLEAVAFLLRDFLELLEQRGCPAKTLTSLGGGARSAVWMEIKADVCGRPMFAAECSEATSGGAALLAGWGAGLIPKGELPCKPAGTEYVPRQTSEPALEAAFRRYKQAFQAVKPLFEEQADCNIQGGFAQEGSQT